MQLVALIAVFAGIYDVSGHTNLKIHSASNPNCFFHSKNMKKGCRGKILHFSLKVGHLRQHVFSCFMTYNLSTNPVTGMKKCVIMAIPKSKYDNFGVDVDEDTVVKKVKVEQHGYLQGDMTFVYVLESIAPRCTILTYCVDVNFCSDCPKVAEKSKLDELLGRVHLLQTRYERNRTVVDNEVLQYHKQLYTNPLIQTKLINTSKDQMALIDRAFKIQESILEGTWEKIRPFNVPTHKYPLVDIRVKARGKNDSTCQVRHCEAQRIGHVTVSRTGNLRISNGN